MHRFSSSDAIHLSYPFIESTYKTKRSFPSFFFLAFARLPVSIDFKTNKQAKAKQKKKNEINNRHGDHITWLRHAYDDN